MDFNSFDSRSAADEGRPLHLKHPATGEPIFDGNRPCIVHVRGTEGRIAQEAFREAAKLDKLPDDATQADYHERICVTARKLIIGFDGIECGDRPATAADADWFLALNISNPLRGKGRSFAEQVLTFAGDRGEYLGKSDAVLSPPRTKSAGSARSQKAATGRAAKK